MTMGPKILLLDATGYIGGDAFIALVQAYPDYDEACFIRNNGKGARIASHYA